GQALEVAIMPAPTLIDAEVTVRINTSVTTEVVDYTASPSPQRGESFVLVGTRSSLGGPVPTFGFRVGVANGNAKLAPPDVTPTGLTGDFATEGSVFVGQRRQRTAKATYTKGGSYRRAIGTDGDGLLLDATVEDPTSTKPSWMHVDITQPRSVDGPP